MFLLFVLSSLHNLGEMCREMCGYHLLKRTAIWVQPSFPRHSPVDDAMQSCTIYSWCPGCPTSEAIRPRSSWEILKTSTTFSAGAFFIILTTLARNTLKPAQTFTHKHLNITSGAGANHMPICNTLGKPSTLPPSAACVLSPFVTGVSLPISMMLSAGTGLKEDPVVLFAAAATTRLPLQALFNNPSLREGNYLHALAPYPSCHEGYYTAFIFLKRAWSDDECPDTRNTPRLCRGETPNAASSQHLQHVSSLVVLRVLVQLHVLSGPIPWIMSKILAALANPFICCRSSSQYPCYCRRRSTCVRVVLKEQESLEGPARRLAEPVMCDLPHGTAACKYSATQR